MIEITGEIPQAAIKTNAKLQSELSELQAQVTGYETAVSKMRTEIDELKAESDKAKQQVKEYKSKIETLHPIAMLALKRLKVYDEDGYHYDIEEIINTVRRLK